MADKLQRGHIRCQLVLELVDSDEPYISQHYLDRDTGMHLAESNHFKSYLGAKQDFLKMIFPIIKQWESYIKATTNLES